MLQEILAAGLFYVPVVATIVNPWVGVVVTTVFVIAHFRHQPFKRALDQLEQNYREPIPFDPMELILD